MRVAVGTRKGLWIGDDISREWQLEGPFLSEAEVASVAWLPSSGCWGQMCVAECCRAEGWWA